MTHLDQQWIRRYKLHCKMTDVWMRGSRQQFEWLQKKRAFKNLEEQFTGVAVRDMLLGHIDAQREAITALYLALGDTNAAIDAVLMEQSKSTVDALLMQRKINHELLTGVSCKCS